MHKKDGEKIKIASYNVRVFSAYYIKDEQKIKQSQNSINWIKKSGAQIVCVQEFYTNNTIKDLNTVKIFKKSYPNISVIPYYDIPPQKLGLAILSKYKIIKSGEVKFSSSTFNQAMFADIKINKNKTLRVYNVHLQSMNIDQKIFSGTQFEKELLFSSIQKYKSGALERAEQLKQILKHINNSPYPAIICGDFNDVPYSYVYEQFRNHFENGFEEKGNGFGFTYSGKYSFLRIDNIFASKQIKFINFKTHDSVWGSDHFPISTDVFIEN
ncbi:MAG: endonuclease/exonuclease/phosphatase family protein [Sporocytophaga sp.]|uniref:endonuclease/exonuclease/phosphatase family protein n=1 Tax=Sporocytophaga sp. TaxID=2231183 RepID=UPI001B2DCDE6|nr:endonuclease/exonuclease/phosphatase family protein [Sporocytophaga sp.]MBO9702312.1 endonuclease/exonuclease/phosphatase family protein [Sporocytophaga sp.]